MTDQNGNQPVPPSYEAAKPKSKWKTWHKVVIGILVALLVLVMIGSCSSNSSKESSSTNATTQESTTTETPEAVQSEPVPEVPKEYQNALKKAQSYSDTMYMSKAGLYDQLTSEYGEGFSAEAAQYGIDNVDADWNYNALKKAESYQDNMAMSPSAIYDQLISEYGEQFTAEEAQYAVDNLSQ